MHSITSIHSMQQCTAEEDILVNFNIFPFLHPGLRPSLPELSFTNTAIKKRFGEGCNRNGKYTNVQVMLAKYTLFCRKSELCCNLGFLKVILMTFNLVNFKLLF